MGSEFLFGYRGEVYPTYLRDGNASRFIIPVAQHFCRGKGLDVGGGKWPFPDALCIDSQSGGDAMKLPKGQFDYVFSSHCLEHIPNYVSALEHWKSRLKPGAPLFLYLPHPDQLYWRPQFNRKHLHSFTPEHIVTVLKDLGFENVIASGRDMYWSFAVVAFNRSVAVDQPFKWLIEENSDHIHADPLFSQIFKKFGADAFRRSSAVEPAFEKIIQKCGFRGRRCVEIGSYNGITAIVLSKYFDEVVSFDIFPHTIKHTLVETLGITNIKFVDVKDNQEKYAFLDGLDFDAAYIDGDHEHDTETDFKAVKRCGRVLFHEYWDTQPPVVKLVDSLRAIGNVTVEGKFALWSASNG